VIILPAGVEEKEKIGSVPGVALIIPNENRHSVAPKHRTGPCLKGRVTAEKTGGKLTIASDVYDCKKQ